MDDVKQGMLIADDVEMNRSVIKKMFRHDFDIYEASTGTEVLQTLENNKIDILLLDIIMPEMNGLEVLMEVKKHNEYKNIAVLVATSTKEKTERKALYLGADDIVAKPYDPVVIRKRVDNILERKWLKQALKEAATDDCKGYTEMLYHKISQELKTSVNKIEIWSENLQRTSKGCGNERQIEQYMDNVRKEFNHIEAALEELR